MTWLQWLALGISVALFLFGLYAAIRVFVWVMDIMFGFMFMGRSDGCRRKKK